MGCLQCSGTETMSVPEAKWKNARLTLQFHRNRRPASHMLRGLPRWKGKRSALTWNLSRSSKFGHDEQSIHDIFNLNNRLLWRRPVEGFVRGQCGNRRQSTTVVKPHVRRSVAADASAERRIS